MKMFSRLFVTIIMVMFIVCLQVLPVRADGQDLVLTPTEEYVKGELLAGREADLELFKEGGGIIHGSVIAAWWKDPAFKDKDIPFFKIKNATISGNIEAEGISLPYAVYFVHCTFNGDIDLDSASTKTFRIDNDPKPHDPTFAPSVINGSVRMGRMIVNGDLGLYQSEFYGPVTMFDADVKGNLFAKGSRFFGTKWKDDKSKYAFELWKIHVAQSTEFTGSVFKGIVSADYAVFGSDVKFDRAIFENQAQFKNIQASDIVDFWGARFMKSVTFESSVITRDLQFTDAVFSGDTNFNYVSVGRFFNFSSSPLNAEDFKDCDLKKLQGAQLKGDTKFEGVRVGEVLNFMNASSTGLFKVHLAEVQGQTSFAGFISPKGLDLSHSRFGDLQIHGGGKNKFDVVKLDSAEINGDLELESVTTANFSAQDMTVKDTTTFRGLNVTDDLNLSSADLGSFTISSKQFWPSKTPKNESLSKLRLFFGKTRTEYTYKFNLRGTTYTDINLIKSEGNKFNYQEFDTRLLNAMVADSLYSPQAYQTLEIFLREKGRSGDAVAMEYARQERERDEILDARSTPWFLSWFLYVFSGYGQHPEYALWWGMLIVFVGAIFFYSKGNYYEVKKDNRHYPKLIWDADSRRQTQTNSFESAKISVYLRPNTAFRLLRIKSNEEKNKKEVSGITKFVRSLLYSAALFFPLSVLKFAEGWEPESEKSYFKAYQIIHKILGIIITPTAVLAFGGWIK